MRGPGHSRRRAAVLVVVAIALAGSWPGGAASAQDYGQREPGVIPGRSPDACVEGDGRVELLLVGSYHMSNPGADQFNLESDDVLTDRRQSEILRVVEGLAAFRPTKVAIESPWGDTGAADKYRAYLAGEHELSRREEEQIGFRLAKAMELETVHAIDYQIGLPTDRLEPLVEQSPELGRYLGELESYGQWAMATLGTWLAENTVGGMLYRMNVPEAIYWADVGYYQFFLPLVHGDDYAGADIVATWFERNLKIFSNLHRIAEPGDRIFVIYGAGHIPHLRYFASQSPYFCLVDPLSYLSE